MYDSDSDGCDLSNMLDDDIETDEDDDDYVPGKQDSDEEYGKKKRKGSKSKFVPGRRNRPPARGRKRKNTDKSDEEDDDDIDDEDEDSPVREKKTNKRKVAKKSPAKKTPAKKSPAKKTPTKKAPAKKTTPKRKKQDSASDDLEDTPSSLRRSSRGSRTRAVSYADADCSEEELYEDQTFDVFQDIKEEKASRAKKKHVDDLWSKFKDDVTEKDDKTKSKKEESDKKDEKSKDEKSNDDETKKEKDVSENIENKEEVENSVKKEEKSDSKEESKDENKEKTDADVKKEDASKGDEISDKTESPKTEDTESKTANGEEKVTLDKDGKSEEDKSNSETKPENGQPAEKEDNEKKTEAEKSEPNGKAPEEKEDKSDSKASETPDDKASVKTDEKKEDTVEKPTENKKDEAAVEKESSSSSNDKTQEPSKEDTSQKKSNVSAGISNFLSSGVKKTGGLSSVMNAIEKKKKTTVLEKTKSDWDSYKSEADIEEELKGNRNAGYLDRQEFLQRVDYNQWENEREMRLYSNRSSVSFGMLKPCPEHVNILFSIPPTTVMQKTPQKTEPIKNKYTTCLLPSTQNIIKRIEEPFSIKSSQNAQKIIKNEDYLKKSRYANSFGSKNNLVLDLSSRPASPCFSVDSAIDLSHDLLSNPGSTNSFDQDSITNENIDFVKTSVFFNQNTSDYKNIDKPVEVEINPNMNSSSSLLSFKKPDLDSGLGFSPQTNSKSGKSLTNSSNHITSADEMDLKNFVISLPDICLTKSLSQETKYTNVIVENEESNDTKREKSYINCENMDNISQERFLKDRGKINNFSDTNHTFNNYEEQYESGVTSNSLLFPCNKDRLSKIKQMETTPKKKKRFLKNIIDMKRKQLNPKENELSNVTEGRSDANPGSHEGSSSEVSAPSKVTTAISSVAPITTDAIESTILQLNRKSTISSECDDIIERDKKQGETSNACSKSEDNGPQGRSTQNQRKERVDFHDSNCSSNHDPPLSSSIPSDSDANFTRLISLTVKGAVQEGVELKRKHRRRTSHLRDLNLLLSDDESNSSAGEFQPPQEFTKNISSFTELISKKLKQKKRKEKQVDQVTTTQDILQDSTGVVKHSQVNSTAIVPKSVKKRGANNKTIDQPESNNSLKLSDFYLSVNSPEKGQQARNKKNVLGKEPDILHEYCKQINFKQNENERSNDYFTMAEKFLSQSGESSSELRESADGSGSNNKSIRKLRNNSKCSKCFCRSTKRTIEDCVICPTDDCMSYDSLETNDESADPDYVPETLSSSTEQSSSSNVSESSLSLPDNIHRKDYLTEQSISASDTQQGSGTAVIDSQNDSPANVSMFVEGNSRNMNKAIDQPEPTSSEEMSDFYLHDFNPEKHQQEPKKMNSYGSVSTGNYSPEPSKQALETPEILSDESTMSSNDGSQSKSVTSSPETESDPCHTQVNNLSKSCVSSVKVVVDDVFKSAELVYLDPYVDCTSTKNQDVDITEKSAEKSINPQLDTTCLLIQPPLSDSNQLENVEEDLDKNNSSIDGHQRRHEVLEETNRQLSGVEADKNNDASSDETDERFASTVSHSNDDTYDDVELVSNVSISKNDENEAKLMSEKLTVKKSNNKDENEIRSISSHVENKIDDDSELISNHSNVDNINAEIDKDVSKRSNVENRSDGESSNDDDDDDDDKVKSITLNVENKIDDDSELISSHSNVDSINAEIDNNDVSKRSDIRNSYNGESELISNHSDVESSNDDENEIKSISSNVKTKIDDDSELISNHSNVDSINAEIDNEDASKRSEFENHYDSETEFISNHSDISMSDDSDGAKVVSNYSNADGNNDEDETEFISYHSDVQNDNSEGEEQIQINESPNILFYSKVGSEMERKRCDVDPNHKQQFVTQLKNNINSPQSNQNTSENKTTLLDGDQEVITRSDDEVLRKPSNPRRSRRVKSDVDVFMSNDESQRITKETELCFSPVKKKKSPRLVNSPIQSKESSSSSDPLTSNENDLSVTAAATSCGCSNSSATKKNRKQRNSTGGLSFTTTRLDFSPNKSAGFQPPSRPAKMSIKKSSRVRTCTLRPDLTPRKFFVNANYNEDEELETILRPNLERISNTLTNCSAVESNLSSELADVSVKDIITTECIPIIQVEDDIPFTGIEVEQEPKPLLETEKQSLVSLIKPSIENNSSLHSFILSDYTSSEETASKVAYAERKTIRKGGRASRRRSSDDHVIEPIVDCSGNIVKQTSSPRKFLDLTQPNPKEFQELTNNKSMKETMYQCDFTIDSPYLKNNFSVSKESLNSNEESSVKAINIQTNCETNSSQTNICSSSTPSVMEQPKPFGKNMAFCTEHMIVRDDNEKIPYIFQKHHIASQLSSSKDLMNNRAHLKSSNRGIQKEPLPGFDIECFTKYLSEPSINTSIMEELGCSPVVDHKENQHVEINEKKHKIFARKSIDILRASCLHVINDSEFTSSEHKESSVSELQNSEMYEDPKSVEDLQFSSPPHKILLTENAVSDFETTPGKSVTSVCDEGSDNSPKRKRFLKKIVRSMINDANVKDNGVKEQRILVERGKEHTPRRRFLYAKKL